MDPIRASDAERDEVVGTLSAAAAEGRLTLGELSERIEAPLTATTRSDLAPLVADLPAGARRPRPAPGPG